MLKSNVGWSIDKSSKKAGMEAAQKAMSNLTKAKVAFVYTSVDNNVEEVLEGVKEFVTNLTNLINSTKNYNAEKATEKDSYFSLETIRDIEDKNNAIEVYGTNIFNSNPFKSAFGTFSEEEYEMAV